MNTFLVREFNAHMRYHDLPGAVPTLVFLHGLGCASTSDFLRASTDPRLAKRRILLIDLLGFGFSDHPPQFSYAMEQHARVVAGMLDHLEIKRCTLIGHSMGGSIGILLAAMRPDLVGNLIVAEGNLDPGPGVVSGPISAMSEPDFVASGYSAFVRQLLHAGFAGYAGTVQASDPIALHRSAVSLIADRRPTYREYFNSLRIPRTYLFGDESRTDPDVDRLPADGITVRIVDNAGHDMMSDNPDGFARAVAESIG